MVEKYAPPEENPTAVYQRFVATRLGVDIRATKVNDLTVTQRDQLVEAIRRPLEQGGLVYATRIGLERTSLPVDSKPVSLSPGMAVTAEIKTDKRRVIEFFLSPVLRYAKESVRER